MCGAVGGQIAGGLRAWEAGVEAAAMDVARDEPIDASIQRIRGQRESMRFAASGEPLVELTPLRAKEGQHLAVRPI